MTNINAPSMQTSTIHNLRNTLSRYFKRCELISNLPLSSADKSDSRHSTISLAGQPEPPNSFRASNDVPAPSIVATMVANVAAEGEDRVYLKALHRTEDNFSGGIESKASSGTCSHHMLSTRGVSTPPTSMT